MTTIPLLIEATNAGFTAVATQRNADWAALNTDIAEVDTKADFAATAAAAATADALLALSLTNLQKAASLDLSGVIVPMSILAFTTAGRVTPGDGGGGSWKRVGSEPTHPGKLNTAGAWWELVSEYADIEIFGGKADCVLNLTTGAFTGSFTDNYLPWLYAVEWAYKAGKQVRFNEAGNYRFAKRPANLPCAPVLYPANVQLGVNTRIILDNGNDCEGFHILASDVTFSGGEVMANAATAIINGTGHRGTCFSIAKWFPSPTAGDPEAPLVKNIIIRDMKLTRRVGSQPAHAIACLARCSHILIENIDFIGAGPTNATGSHGNAVLTHWGAWSDGVTNEDDPNPLTQSKFLPGHYSHHPNNIRVKSIRCRNVGRIIACSASYAVDVDGVEFDGPVQGSQIVDLPVGDEADTYAHPDDRGKVYNGFSFRNIRCRNLTGTGSNAVTAIDMSGYSTSKQIPADLAAYAGVDYAGEPFNTEVAKYRQPEWKNVLFENITFDFGPANPPSATVVQRMLWIRNFRGNVTFKNIRATARGNAVRAGVPDPYIQAILMANNVGKFTFENFLAEGHVVIDSTDSATFKECSFAHKKIDAGTAAITLTGSYPTITTNGATYARGATSFTLASALTGTNICIGDRLSYSGGAVYCEEFALGGAGVTLIKVSPLPTALAAGTVFTIDHGNRDLNFDGVVASQGSSGYDISNSVGTRINGGEVINSGQYGVLVDTGAHVEMKGTMFANGGQRRAVLPMTGLALTAGGSGYTSTPTVTITGGGGAGATAVAVRPDGVATITLGAAGSGYVTAPTVSITGGGGSGAAATAAVSGGIVAGITLTNAGANYTSAPTVTLTGGGGTGATATASIARAITGVVMTNGGSGYTSSPTVTITGGGGTGATATASNDASLATRDLVVNAGMLDAEGVRFAESRFISTNFVVGAGALKVGLKDCVFSGTPLSAKTQIAALTNAQPVHMYGNVDAAGLPVYRKATWSPQVKFGGNSVGLVQAVNNATYTVFEDRVELDYDIVVTTKGSSTGSCTIGGLPFPVAGSATTSSGAVLLYGVTLASAGACLSRIISGELGIYQQTTTSISSVQASAMADGSRIIGSIVYQRI